MKLKEQYKALQENEEKIPIIDDITEFHPGLGVDFGVATYVGGFVDTGHWLTDKLLQKRMVELKVILSYVKDQMKKSKEPRKFVDENQLRKEFELKQNTELIWGRGHIDVG